MGLKRPKRASSEGVAAAVMACSSPLIPKKFRQKSVMGRRYSESGGDGVVVQGCYAADSPSVFVGARRGSTRLARCTGALIRQRVVSQGRGAADVSAVAAVDRLGVEASAHAPASKKKAARLHKQAPLPLENIRNRGDGVSEERPLEEGGKMAARIRDRQETILILSDSDEDGSLGKFKGALSVSGFEASPSSADRGEIRLKGIAFGEAEVSDNGGRAQVSLDFWSPSCANGVPGCGNSHALSGHEEHRERVEHVRPAFAPGHTVGVSTPLGQREEERVRPGAALPTSGDVPSSTHLSKRCVVYDELSASRSAGGLTQDIGAGEEFLDFEEVNEAEGLVGGVQRGLGGQGNNKSQSFGVLQEQRNAAVRSDRQGGERSLYCSSGNLPRGKERPFISGTEGRGTVDLR
ncbi:hypothetical protein NDU88_005837 [Pleurodeles waltl]|uniref:Uncharacterized protein n=1 Tax=Pleurodeles waltl TaxID=8319 RepID=A0AAV7MYQ0_PLEWA|nr:hypothetical protein NDU88_005837 [Pleurodeles waltl]